MTKRNVEMDERAVAVDNRAGYIAFQVMMWLLLVALGVRGWKPEWATWNGFPVDILGVMFAGTIVHTAYGARARVFGPRRVRSMIGSALLAAALATLVLMALRAWLR